MDRRWIVVAVVSLVAMLIAANWVLAPQYIDTGKARLVYKNMPIIGPESQPAAEAQRLGVTGTPTFFINGRRYEGVLPAERLASIIDAGQR